MKVGDLVELKNSVLETHPARWLGVIVHKHQNAIKVHWFNGNKKADSPSPSQFVLKVRVVSEL
jgi:hypothetical protein